MVYIITNGVHNYSIKAMTTTADSMKFHLQQLPRHCRICGNHHRGTTYTVTSYRASLLSAFDMNTTSDNSEIHPTLFCQSCYSVIKRAETAKREKKEYKPSVTPFVWSRHDSDCTVSKTIVLMC